MRRCESSVPLSHCGFGTCVPQWPRYLCPTLWPGFGSWATLASVPVSHQLHVSRPIVELIRFHGRLRCLTPPVRSLDAADIELLRDRDQDLLSRPLPPSFPTPTARPKPDPSSV